MARASSAETPSVFINCSFTPDWRKQFHSIVFTVIACGFRPRNSQEADDAGEIRLEKIIKLIEDSDYSIHDMSAVSLDVTNQLPRFNMPFELGIVIALKKAMGRPHASRPVLVMEGRRYDTSKCLSDIAGQDFKDHGGDSARIVRVVTSWLLTASKSTKIPGYRRIQRQFENFYEMLPAICDAADLEVDGLSYPNFVTLASQFLIEENAQQAVAK